MNFAQLADKKTMDLQNVLEPRKITKGPSLATLVFLTSIFSALSDVHVHKFR